MTDADEPTIRVLNSRIDSLGFKYFPFDYQFDVRFFYPAPSRMTILTHILDSCHRGFVRMCLIGKKGSGKTTLAMMLSALLEQENKVELRYYSPQEFRDYEPTLKMLVFAFGLEWQGDVEQNLQRLKDALIHQYEIGKPYFLIIEQYRPEGYIHAISILRELANVYIRHDPAFHFIWLADELPSSQPSQVTRNCEQVINLTDMSYREMAGMIRYRCRVAGRKKPIFTTDALKNIFHLSHGNPGLALRLCDFALYEMASDNKTLLGVKEVEGACRWIFEFRWPDDELKGK